METYGVAAKKCFTGEPHWNGQDALAAVLVSGMACTARARGGCCRFALTDSVSNVLRIYISISIQRDTEM